MSPLLKLPPKLDARVVASVALGAARSALATLAKLFQTAARNRSMHNMTSWKVMILALLLAGPLAAAPPAELPGSDADARQLYRAGHTALDRQDWVSAARSFRSLESTLARSGAAGRDAALYWQAYALERSGDRRGAAGLAQKLTAEFPSSPWLDDARDLLGVVTEDSDRLLAVDALMTATPERAVPILREVLNGAHSDSVKKRALFVLVQLAPAEAGEAIDALLTGANSPALKREAVQTLALSGGGGSLERLGDYYARETDASLKRAVLDSALISGRAELIVRLARSERDAELQSHAIRVLGAMGQSQQIAMLFQDLTDPDAQRSAIDALAMAADGAALAQLALGSAAEQLRVHAVRALGIVSAERSVPALLAIYRGQSSPAVRRAVIDALVMQHAADALLELYRQETNSDHKRALLHALNATGNEAALNAIRDTLQ